MVTPEEREAFANVIDNIKQVTEIASEPALAAASEKDILRREIADKLEKLVPPPAGS
jgi:hypothetical protein